MELRYILLILGSLTALLYFIFLILAGDIVYGFLVWFSAAMLLGKEYFLVSIPGFPDIYLERIIFVLLIPFFFMMIRREREALLPLTSLEYIMVALLVIIIVSMSRTGFLVARLGEDRPFSIFLNGFLFPFSFYYFGKTFLYREERIRILLWGLFFFYAYLIITAYLEHFRLFSLVFPDFIADPLKGIHFGRARGPFLNAPVNGWVILTLFFSTLFLRSISRGILTRMILLVALILVVPVIFYTYTRAVWLAFILAPLAIMVFSRHLMIRGRFILFPVALAILLVSIFWGNLGTGQRELGGVMQVTEVEDRIALFQITKAIFKEFPFYGVGFGRFLFAISGNAPGLTTPGTTAITSQHNIFFGVLSELGLIGLLPLVLLLYFILRYSIILYRSLPDEGFFSKDLVTIFWAIFITFLVSASFIQTQYFIAANSLTFLWVGMMAGLYQRREGLADRRAD